MGCPTTSPPTERALTCWPPSSSRSETAPHQTPTSPGNPPRGPPFPSWPPPDPPCPDPEGPDPGRRRFEADVPCRLVVVIRAASGRAVVRDGLVWHQLTAESALQGLGRGKGREEQRDIRSIRPRPPGTTIQSTPQSTGSPNDISQQERSIRQAGGRPCTSRRLSRTQRTRVRPHGASVSGSHPTPAARRVCTMSKAPRYVVAPAASATPTWPAVMPAAPPTSSAIAATTPPTSTGRRTRRPLRSGRGSATGGVAVAPEPPQRPPRHRLASLSSLPHPACSGRRPSGAGPSGTSLRHGRTGQPRNDSLPRCRAAPA